METARIELGQMDDQGHRRLALVTGEAGQSGDEVRVVQRGSVCDLHALS